MDYVTWVDFDQLKLCTKCQCVKLDVLVLWKRYADTGTEVICCLCFDCLAAMHDSFVTRLTGHEK